ARWNADHGGSSQRIVRVLLLADVPSIDANEITDKGYINQRLAPERRKADVERLFAPAPDADVPVVPPRSVRAGREITGGRSLSAPIPEQFHHARAFSIQ